MRLETGYVSYLIPRIIRMAACSGFFIDSNTRILDFGCGDGRNVYDWRDEGFDAHGFDLYDAVKLRSETDRGFFRTSEARTERDRAITTIDPAAFRLPYKDGTFDLVLSSTVLEHVQEYGAVFSELSRVMKPASIGFHTFPAIYTFIEPHINVPFGTLFKSRWYFWLWAWLGVRNEFQRLRSAREVAELNWRYANTSLSYKLPSEMIRLASPYFTEIKYEPEFWEFPERFKRLIASRLYKLYYDHFKFSVLKTVKLPRRGAGDA